MDKLFTSPQELIDLFNISNHSNEYFDLTPFTDGNIGFSIQRNYPENIKFIPAKSKNGVPDSVALIKVVYYRNDIQNDDKIHSELKVPLYISVSLHKRYLNNHIDYNFNDDNSPSKNSVKLSKQSPQPQEINYHGVYFVDHRKGGMIYDQTKTIIDGNELLETVFNEHCKTTSIFNGLSINKYKVRSIKRSIVSKIGNLLTWFLLNVLGRTLEPEDKVKAHFLGYKSDDMRVLDIDSFNIFGYKAPKSIVIFFFFIVAITHILLHFTSINSLFLYSIATNTLLSLTYTVISIFTLDSILPKIVLHLINKLNSMKYKYIFEHK